MLLTFAYARSTGVSLSTGWLLNSAVNDRPGMLALLDLNIAVQTSTS